MDSSGNDYAENEMNGTKKKKWTLRLAGEAPELARQQQDAAVRRQMKAIKKPIEMLQKQSLPISRTDNFNPTLPGNKSISSKQSRWPFVVHSAFCFTDQAPNGDGSGEVEFLDKPKLHMWVGSQAAAEWVAKHFDQEKQPSGEMAFETIICTDYESYFNGFRSDSALNKEAPPRPGGNIL